DISNPAQPSVVWRMGLPLSEAYTVHQVMIRGNLMFVSWYQAGLYVFDVTDPRAPVLLGSYDTFPGPVSGYNGAWGIFNSGDDYRIRGFDMATGVYILYLDYGGAPGTGVTPGQSPGSTARSVRGPQAADLPLSALADDQIASLSDGALVVTLTSGNDSLS